MLHNSKQGANAAWTYPEDNWACRVDITPEDFNSALEDLHMFKNNANRDLKDYTCDTISHYEQDGLYTFFFYKKLFYKKVSLILAEKLRNP